MKRTTIMASDDLLERLRAIARQEDTSLAEVIRQGLEWRAGQPGKRLRFIGIAESTEEPHDIGRRAGEIEYMPPSWR